MKNDRAHRDLIEARRGSLEESPDSALLREHRQQIDRVLSLEQALRDSDALHWRAAHAVLAARLRGVEPDAAVLLDFYQANGEVSLLEIQLSGGRGELLRLTGALHVRIAEVLREKS